MTGGIRFGERPLYAPPANPDVGYPPGFTILSPRPDTGFELTILDATFSASR